MKQNEIMSSSEKSMKLEIIMLTEITHLHKASYSLMCGVLWGGH
jgi:hypothetical protein